MPDFSVDAVIVPAGHGTAGTPYWALAQLAAEFAQLLGVRVLHTRELLDGRTFLPRTLQDCLNFPQGHPHAGEPRYRWEPRPENDGVLYGRLLP